MFECPTIAELAQVAIETQGVRSRGIVIGDVPLTPIRAGSSSKNIHIQSIGINQCF